MVQQYVDYFRTLIARNRHINSFFMMDINEAMKATSNPKNKYPYFILDTLNGRYCDSHRDNPLNLVSGGFIILDKSNKVDDFVRETEILDRTFAIGAQVIAKMNDDILRRNPQALSVLKNFEPNDVKWQLEGPLYDNAFGCSFSFPITRFADLEVNPNDWT